ncbi:MAG: aldolase [Christensenellaceae bacterium]|jgi:DhnA family fructose-bisphosphate aldolase class Ia|nr:aldolase [Christensenellaceae bacterium]
MSTVHRKNHIFRADGKALILAMDHGANFNVLPALKDPGKVIRACAEAGADAFLSTVGMLDKFAGCFLGKGVILRIDGGVSKLGAHDKPLQTVVTPEQALAMGADSIITMCFPGSRYENETLASLTRNIQLAHRWGLPVVAEALPRGFEGGEDARTAENIMFACRQAAELGADIIKTEYTGSIESMRTLVESVYAPVVILGGAKKVPEEQLLQEIRDALDAGAAGIAMGRNIWGHANPAKYTAAIAKLIHENATVEAALQALQA